RGLGELVTLPDARFAGSGSPAALSPSNPGTFLHLTKTSINVTILGAAAHGTQAGSSRAIGNIRPAGFQAAAPLPTKTRILLGIDQRFAQDFDVWSDSSTGTTYRYHVVGRGGIYNFKAGIAQALFDRVCLGLEYCRLLGGSHEAWRFQVTEGGGSSTDTIEIDYSGGAVRLGTSFQTGLFTIAAAYEPGFNITCQRFKRVHGVVSDSVRTYRIHFPQTLCFGSAIEPTEGLMLLTGLELRPWSRATVNDTSVEDFRNAWRGSIGAELEMLPDHSVRIGYSHEAWYYEARPSLHQLRAPIKEHGLHLGTGIPIPKFGSLEISAELLFRNSQPLKETAGRLMLTLAYSETWAKRTRRWGY
ncbi:MAG: hypothetical protein ABIK44_06470, partial [candidate division WOR-3 bacterium]